MRVKESQKFILCMIDLSEDSRRALKAAAQNAFIEKADLLVLYPYRLKNQQVGEEKVSIKRRLEMDAHKRFNEMKLTISELTNIHYTFSAEVGFDTDRLEAHLQSQPLHSLYLCKSFAIQADSNSDWSELISKLNIPMVLVS